MALDRITEEIAHFVGLFHLESEAAKLRLEYQSFRLERDGPALDPLAAEDLAIRSPFALRDFKAKLTPVIPPDPEHTAFAGHVPGPMSLPLEAISPVPPAEAPVASLSFTMPALAMPNGMFVIMPNSVVMVIEQVGLLSDNDLLWFDGSGDFVAPSFYLSLLQDLGALAQSLSMIDPGLWPPGHRPDFDAAKTVLTTLSEFEAPQHDMVQTVLLRGEEAEGIFVNGELVEEAPLFKDLLPTYLAPEPAEEEDEDPDAEGPAAKPAIEMPSDGVTDHDPGPYAVDPGHNLVTGGNRVINDTVLKSVWVDAPVIAAAGNILRMDVISQVNLRVEASSLPGDVQAAASTSLNVAGLTQISSVPEAEEGKDGDTSEDTFSGLPSFWNVTRLEGDLILMNWVQQHIFVTDYDRVEVTFSAAATFIGTGENLVFNEALILTLGFHYDLIMIGGDMITINQISQVNVLFDHDVVTGDLPEGAQVLAGDNLQMNMAKIETTGVDTVIETPESFASDLEDLAAGGKTLSAKVAQDDLFEGKEMLSVLYISGDMIQTNIIEQHNYLGDSDQIHFIKDMFSTAEGAEVTVTTGSNAQLNAATIQTVGLDSKLMAGGEVYSDAVLYQAELIDEKAAPTGVHLDPLATEALAFLVEDMIAPAPKDDYGAGITVSDDPGTVDVMQTMLG